MSYPNVFDVIIVGAGTSGALLPAAYLAKAGAKVLMLDGKHEAGTFQITNEIFPNAMITPYGAGCFFSNNPAWEDLELYDKYGLEVLTNGSLVGSLFDDGKCLQFFLDPARTYEEFARFSKKDADTAMGIMGRALENLIEFNEIAFFSEPKPEKLERIWELCAEIWGIPEDQFRDMNFFELAETTFESDYVKSHWAGLPCTKALGDPMDKWYGVFTAVAGLEIAIPGMVKGGNHTLVHTLLRVFQDHGGTVIRSCPVEKIIVENGVATGVRLCETANYPEKTIYAKHGVLSNAGARLTLELVGEDIMKKADYALALKMKHWEMSGRASTVHCWTAKGLPKWKAIEWDPSFKNNFFFYKLPSKFDDLKRWAIASKSNDTLGAFGIYGEFCIPSAVDKLAISPEGYHSFRIEEVLPYNGFRRLGHGPEYWDEIKGELMRRRTEIVESLAPGFKASLIDEMYMTPIDIWRYNPSAIEGNAIGGETNPNQFYLGKMPYRTPIKGLYMSHGNWPLGLSICGVGYIAACVIAEDMGIRNQPWWKGRPGEWFMANIGKFMVNPD
jgi:beta-carotene ketolase (CrtO type)